MVDLKCLKYRVTYYGEYPVNSLSALMNMMVLYVWSAEDVYHPTTYLFKMLAVTDIISAIGRLAHVPFDYKEDIEVKYIFSGLTSSNRKLNVQVTLLLALVRLFKVMPSLDSDRLCSRRRMRIAVTAIFIIALVINGSALIFNASYDNGCIVGEDVQDVSKAIVLFINDHVAFSIPALLQMVFMFVVLWRLRQVIGKRQSEERLVVLKRLTCAVFFICSFTFITHFVMRVPVYLSTLQSKELFSPLNYALHAVLAVLIGMNGLINVLFYSLLVPRFRHLAHYRYTRLVKFFASVRHSTLFPAASPKSPARLPITTMNDQPAGITDMEVGTMESLGTGMTSVKAFGPTTTGGATMELTEITDTAVD